MESDQDTPLGQGVEDDFEDGHEPLGTEHYKGTPFDPIDEGEKQVRNSDYEGKFSGQRVRIGGKDELQLDRIDLTAGGRSSGGGDGADWESNFAGKGSTALDSPNAYVGSSIGDTSYLGGSDGVDEAAQSEMRDAGLRLGMNSVDTAKAAFCIQNHAYVMNKERWRTAPDDYKKYTYAKRKWKRRNRSWEEKRADSLARKGSTIFRGFQKDRSAADPTWIYADPDLIEQWDGRDSRSAYVMAERWRMKQDIKALDALVVKYASYVAGVQPETIRTRWRRKPHEKQLAEFIFVHDMISCGCVSDLGFDKDELLSQYGDDLIEMDTPNDVTDESRRRFIIEGSHDLYASGALYPPFCWDALNGTLAEVVAILEEAGLDLLQEPGQEPGIDWSEQAEAIARKRGWKP